MNRIRVAAVLAALAGVACSSPAHDEAVLRFIDRPAEQLWQSDSLLLKRPEREWSFGDPQELARWTVRNADREQTALASGLTLSSSKRHLRLLRSIDLAADRVDALELELGAARGLTVTLDWARRGERFSLDRRLSLSSRELLPGTGTTARFEVAAHPHWSGTIRRLRIGIGGPPNRQVTLRRLTAVHERPGSEALVTAMGTPWLFDVERETRAVLLAPPGLPIERPAAIPRDARLTFGYTIPDGLPATIRFRVVFSPSDGAPDIDLFTDDVAPQPAAAWRQAEVDLSELSGDQGTLRLATEIVGAAGRPPAAGDPLPPSSQPIYDPYRDGLPVWSSPEVLAPARRGRRAPNIVLVSIDTLRADGLSLYGNPRPTSPHLDAWAEQRATVFDSAVAAAPWTLPAHVSLLTGLEAYRHGVNYGFPPAADLEMLAERLHRAGYRTLAVTGGSFLDPRFGLAQGFDRYRYFSRRGESDPEELEAGLAATEALLAEAPDRPFFLFFHTYEVHAPYLPRQPFFEQLAGYRPTFGAEPSPHAAPLQENLPDGKPLRAVALQSPDSARAGAPSPDPPPPEPLPPDGAPELATLARDLYDASVAYTDDRLQRLFGALAEHGLTDDTIVVVTSDHGELLGEHGLAGHSYLFDENLLVPLMISGAGGSAPRGSAGRRVNRQVRQVDVVPTVLELAGLPAPEGLDGRSLVSLMAGQDDDGRSVPNVAVTYMPQPRRGAAIRVAGREKQLLRTNAWAGLVADSVRYDLEADPRETEPLPGDPVLDQRLRRLLARGYRGLSLEIAAGRRAVVAEIEGASVSRRGVQSLDAACRCVTWRPAGFAQVTVEPGSTVTLRLEEPAGSDLVVRTRFAGEEPQAAFAARLQVLDPQPQRIVRQDDRWLLTSDGPRDPLLAPGVELRWRGRPPAPAGAVGGSGDDSDLRQQLKALGYL